MAVLSGATDLASLIGIGLLGRAAFGAGKAGKVAKGALKTYEAAQKATSKAYGNYFVKSAATNAALNSNLQGAEAFQNFVRAAKAENKAASQIPILEKSLQQSFFTNERAWSQAQAASDAVKNAKQAAAAYATTTPLIKLSIKATDKDIIK